MAVFHDQMNRSIRLESKPRRIVSLVPSQTELLHYLGLEREVVAITKFCIKPTEWHQTKIRIGGTKSVDIELIKNLHPDLIIGNKEENTKSDIDALSEIAPIWMSDIFTLDDALKMILSIGRLVQREEQARELVDEVQAGFAKLNNVVQKLGIKNQRVLYFIWHEPNMVAGKSTFIDDILTRAGFINAATEERYPEANGFENTDLLFLSTEPYPFKQEHKVKFGELYPSAQIEMVDGEAFSWYGSRLKVVPDYLIELLNKMTSNGKF